MPTSSELWPLLRRHILLGTDQQALPDALRQQLVKLQISEEETEPFLLEALGTLHLLRKGAPNLPKAAASPALPAAATEQQACSWRSVQHLQAILDGHHSAALPEFARLLRQHEKALPAASLPDLLEQCSQSPDLWPLLQPILGERGHWLLRQHPEWSQLLPPEQAASSWAETKGKTAQQLLAHWRQLNPTAARESLAEHWPQLDHKAKARLLPSLQAGLSPSDEDFLTQALAEKRKDIRIAAASLLAQLPNSELVAQYTAIATQVLQRQGKKIVLQLPDELPKTAQSLGIYPTGSKQVGGLILSWLQQIMARVPFQVWEDHWQQSAAELIPLFAQAEHGSSLLVAITESLNRTPHEAAQTALLRWWVLLGQDKSWDHPAARQLLQSASDSQFNDTLLLWLEHAGPLVPADSMASYWLGLGQHQWSPVLSRLLVFGFRDVIQTRQTNPWNLYHYKKLLEVAAYQSQASLLEVFKNGWSFRSAGFGKWHADVEKLLQTLHFRLEMQKGMKE